MTYVAHTDLVIGDDDLGMRVRRDVCLVYSGY